MWLRGLQISNESRQTGRMDSRHVVDEVDRRMRLGGRGGRGRVGEVGEWGGLGRHIGMSTCTLTTIFVS